MERIKPGFPAILAEALRLVPLHIHAYLDCDVFTATDPVFAGLHRYDTTVFGARYADVPHVVYPYHMTHMPRDRRRVTMVLPHMDLPIRSVVHEFGHVLHYRLGFVQMPLEPVSDYATSNEYEAFAEAFAAWVLPEEFPWAATEERMRTLLESTLA